MPNDNEMQNKSLRVLRLTAPNANDMITVENEVISNLGVDAIAEPVNESDTELYLNIPTDDSLDEVVEKLNTIDHDFTSWKCEICTADDAGVQVERVVTDVHGAASAMPTVKTISDDDAAELAALKAESEHDHVAELQAEAEKRRAEKEAEEEVKRKAEEAERARLEAEQAEKAAEEAEQQARRQALETTGNGMLDYVANLDMEHNKLIDCVLPEFAATAAARAVSEAVDTPLMSLDKKRLLAIVPSVSLSIEDGESVDEVDNRDFSDEDNNTSMLNYLDKTSELTRQFANDRATVRQMTDDEFKSVEQGVSALVGGELKNKFGIIDSTREQMFADVRDMTAAVADYRADYADGMKDAMEAAALEAARQYANNNRMDTLEACSEEMLEATNTVSETLIKNSARAYEVLLYADRIVDMHDEIDADTRNKYHAYLAASMYRVASDRAMAELVNDITYEKLYQITMQEQEMEPEPEPEPEPEYTYPDNESAPIVESEPEPESESEPEHEDANPQAELEGLEDNLGSDETTTLPVQSDETDEFSVPSASLGDLDDLDTISSSDSDEDGFDTLDDSVETEDDSDDMDSDEDDSELTDKERKKKEKERKKAQKKAQKKAERDAKKANRKPIPFWAKVVGGIAGGVAVIGLVAVIVMSMLPNGTTSKEVTTDPHGTYQVGDTYTVNVKGKDGKVNETDVVVEKFIDSTDDNKDVIVAKDKSGNEYHITYGKMEKAQKKDTSANANTNGNTTSDTSTSNPSEDKNA